VPLSTCIIWSINRATHNIVLKVFIVYRQKHETDAVADQWDDAAEPLAAALSRILHLQQPPPPPSSLTARQHPLAGHYTTSMNSDTYT